MSEEKKLVELRQEEYTLRSKANRLRREVYEQASPSKELLDALAQVEADLRAKEKERATAQASDRASNGLVFDNTELTGLLGPATTKLEATIHVRMAQVPTSICHLLDQNTFPLVSCTIQNLSSNTRRMRLTSYVEDYSAHAVTTFELKPNEKKEKDKELRQLPTFFPNKLRDVTELTRATLNVMLEELGAQVELHETRPVWLLARTSAPLAIQDLKSGEWKDMSRYYGAFVTPNAPSVLKFLRKVVAYHPAKRLAGYEREVEPQVRAIFDALKAEEIAYVNSLIAFSPDQGFSAQRVRLPRESLEDHQANCVDGTVLFASLIEAISLNPAIVVVPQHVFVGWETGEGNDQWAYLETTRIGDSSFEDACRLAKAYVERYEPVAKQENDPLIFQRWSLRELRATHGVTPLE